MWQQVQGTFGYKKANPSIGRRIRGKQQIKECEAARF
jgi:hypothetical protein